MNKIVLKEIKKVNDTISYVYEIIGDWRHYFYENEKFFVSYGDNIEKVPDSIAVIPFLTNILPMAWVFDSEIVIDEIDKDFYDHLDDLKRGYSNMYPRMDFKGNLSVGKVIDNSYYKPTKVAAFFSGGVDAFATLVSHVDEHPILITLWGSDITFDDNEGWRRVYKHAIDTGREFQCQNIFIKSSFRRFLNEAELSQYVFPIAGDNWWHGFQHGIGLIGHIAPIAYIYKLDTIYIASSFTLQDKGIVTCASDPTIDNYVYIASCRTWHDGYEYTRQEKIANICRYKRLHGKNIQLRVCWQSSGGSNCCDCEKCYRTICGIIAEGENPKEMGFIYNDSIYKKMYHDIRYKFFFDDVTRSYWDNIRQKYVENEKLLESYPALQWIIKQDFSNMDKSGISIRKKMYHILKKIESKLVK